MLCPRAWRGGSDPSGSHLGLPPLGYPSQGTSPNVQWGLLDPGPSNDALQLCWAGPAGARLGRRVRGPCRSGPCRAAVWACVWVCTCVCICAVREWCVCRCVWGCTWGDAGARPVCFKGPQHCPSKAFFLALPFHDSGAPGSGRPAGASAQSCRGACRLLPQGPGRRRQTPPRLLGSPPLLRAHWACAPSSPQCAPRGPGGLWGTGQACAQGSVPGASPLPDPGFPDFGA